MEALQSIIGCDAQSATMYLEMSGGDVDSAVALYFSMMGDDTSPSSSSTQQVPDWHSLVWPSEGASPAWLSQTLGFDAGKGLALSQDGNGPCGVLAAFQAAVIAQCHLQQVESFFELGPNFTPSQLLVSQTLVAMLSQCTEEGVLHVAKWCTDGTTVEFDQILKSEVTTLLDVVHRNLCVAGGCILVVISALCTRGCSRVRAELSKEGTPSLVLAPTYICSMELVSLLLCGRATSNILAYDSITQVKQPAWSTALGVGMLSTHESDGQPVADDLKTPATPVWLLHGGDHFTVLFSSDRTDTTLFHHWNGLAPSGPRMTSLTITASDSGVSASAPSVMKSSYCKPKEGEVEDVVQAHPDDRKSNPDDWTAWRFEVVLGGKEEGDEEGASEGESSDGSVTLFELSQFPPTAQDRWRCRACYATRFKTMCFGLNDPSTVVDVKCEHCDKPRNVTGHSIWLKFAELPRAWQGAVEKRHGPKILGLLRTKWPRATVELAGGSAEAGLKLPGV